MTTATGKARLRLERVGSGLPAGMVCRDMSLMDKFMANIIPVTETGCWLWHGGWEKSGYGFCRFIDAPRDLRKAHRLSWFLFNGEHPGQLYVCHKCDVKPCVNPAHLFLGNASDNLIDLVRKGLHANTKKTHCSNGHEFNDANTYMHERYPGVFHRFCKVCNKERQRCTKLRLAS